MQLRTLVLASMLVTVFGAAARPASAVVAGQIDTFTSGTTEGWNSGAGPNPVPPTVVLSGGPSGAGDAYLLVRGLGGVGAGSKLTAINTLQWTGNYTAAGIVGLRMDLMNAGAKDLVVRVMVSTPTNEAISAATVVVAGGGWIPAFVSLAPGDLTPVFGTASGALAGATELRIMHDTNPTFPPDAMAGALGVDNIEAIGSATPAPTTSWGRIKGLYR